MFLWFLLQEPDMRRIYVQYHCHTIFQSWEICRNGFNFGRFSGATFLWKIFLLLLLGNVSWEVKKCRITNWILSSNFCVRLFDSKTSNSKATFQQNIDFSYLLDKREPKTWEKHAHSLLHKSKGKSLDGGDTPPPPHTHTLPPPLPLLLPGILCCIIF